MKKRKMTAKQRKYFGKRTSKKKVVRKMAKRRYSRVRSYARKGIGGMKGMFAPILGGVADQYLNSMLPVSGVGATAIGMVMHDNTLKTIGLYQFGGSIGNLIPLPGIGGSGSGAML